MTNPVPEGLPWLVLERETGDFYALESPRAVDGFLAEFVDDIPRDFRLFDRAGREITPARNAEKVVFNRHPLPDEGLPAALVAFASQEGLALDSADVLGSFLARFKGYR